MIQEFSYLTETTHMTAFNSGETHSAESMINQCRQLETLLQEQNHTYQTLLSLETEKQAAILARSAGELQAISEKEETCLKKSEQLEQQRLQLMQALGAEAVSDLLSRQHLPEASRENIRQLASALAELLSELKNLNLRNQRMLKDSRDFFASLISAMAGQNNDTYAPPQGKSNPATGRPLFLDLSC